MAMDKTHNSPAKGKSRDPIHWVRPEAKHTERLNPMRKTTHLLAYVRYYNMLSQSGDRAIFEVASTDNKATFTVALSTSNPNPSANRPLEMDSAMPWVILQAPSRRVRLSTGDSTMKTYPLSFTATIGETLQKYIRVWNKTLRKLRAVEQAVIFLHQQEGPTRPGGSHTAAFVELAGGDESRSQYIFGDRFCGAEGVWRGTLQAGLHIRCGFDKCPKAMETYRLNFTSAVGETCEVAHFLTNDSEDIIVDILHFSPPCQTFSSAKTIAAATDSANEACIFSSRELLLKIKPRVATMEETSGLQERHKEFLYATIHTFVDLGYSIRWKFSEAIQ
ncbi:c5 cytosine methyltransferase DmtA [Coccidioides immitis H538.4]|uniref:DNA (cytosine-5-)-methyltransferase n=1 Tax=Coccidioides immitis H538.4 TaxID=396776 RepID=A0A0J8RVL5_COCIT|nr:c5 cytosine methyltransferase DmtA [Coccidioides immitis H538.4]